ncbi:hypothetical protein [Antrihabitans cavernicola]|uniref:Uncharacterized protein n=1 Tax=Antrihabitans cavernicola TaxID=2495913 RepID=A0A5A7S735_9NOCA|nr:hypothetical protein [Spelaeibacter cavernicola]KAA0017062.1 hypothetical protein FOY51_25315 [Spelaeibacter cavernicola]
MSAGLRFREVMTGQVTMGEKDPWVGYRSPASAAVTFTARITIEDIGTFLADPDHAAALSADLDVPRLGGRIASRGGVFGVFTPTDDARTTHIRYELPITIDDRPHWLHGVKVVTVAAPWRLWPATTTLLTFIHEGVDDSGAIVGAGVLKMGAGKLIRSVTTLRGAVAQYLSFFAGGLISTYLLRRRA